MLRLFFTEKRQTIIVGRGHDPADPVTTLPC